MCRSLTLHRLVRASIGLLFPPTTDVVLSGNGNGGLGGHPFVHLGCLDWLSPTRVVDEAGEAFLPLMDALCGCECRVIVQGGLELVHYSLGCISTSVVRSID